MSKGEGEARRGPGGPGPAGRGEARQGGGRAPWPRRGTGSARGRAGVTGWSRSVALESVAKTAAAPRLTAASRHWLRNPSSAGVNTMTISGI